MPGEIYNGRQRLLSMDKEGFRRAYSATGPEGARVRALISPEDIYRSFVLSDLRAGMQRDLGAIRRRGEREQRSAQSLSKDLARGYGPAGARRALAMQAGYGDAANRGTAGALAARRDAFIGEATDPANMGFLMELQEDERKRRADQALGQAVLLGFLKGGADVGQSIGGQYLNSGLSRGLAGPNSRNTQGG